MGESLVIVKIGNIAEEQLNKLWYICGKPRSHKKWWLGRLYKESDRCLLSDAKKVEHKNYMNIKIM